MIARSLFNHNHTSTKCGDQTNQKIINIFSNGIQMAAAILLSYVIPIH